MNDKFATTPGYSSYLVFWLRWILVLPVGLVAAVLISFPVHIVVLIVHSQTEDSFNLWQLVSAETLERWALALVAPVALTSAGAWTAPAFKTHTGTILSILWVGLVFAAIAYVLVSGKYQVDWWTSIPGFLLALTGAAWGGSVVHTNYRGL